MIVEHHLRLDQRIVPHCEGAIGLALAQCFGGFDHRQCAAATVVGDARIGTLEVVLDGDVAKHVVGQRAQQPHRIHNAGKIAAEGDHVASRLAHQRKVFVLSVVCATA